MNPAWLLPLPAHSLLYAGKHYIAFVRIVRKAPIVQACFHGGIFQSVGQLFLPSVYIYEDDNKNVASAETKINKKKKGIITTPLSLN
jgi:hypothetical protein